MFGRGQEELRRQLDEHARELQALRREVAELGAAHRDAVELALTAAVPNSLLGVLAHAGEAGWNYSYRRKPHHPGHGTIDLENPADPVHTCSIDLPLPDDPDARRRIETDARMRIGFPRAA
jgi:hypothetical protein